MGGRIRSLDWSGTPLGPLETWPKSLRIATGIMLGAASPIALCWGPDLIFLYNDPWVALLGNRHPHALGRTAREVLDRIWDTVGPLLAGVMAGRGAAEMHDQQFTLYRHGPPEEAWFDASFNPLPQEDGSVAGVLVIAAETTERVRADQALRESEQRLAAELDAARRLQQVSIDLIQADTMEELYDRILDTAAAILKADFASIQILHPERGPAGELELVGNRGFSSRAARFWQWVRPESHSACGVALRTRQRVAVADVQACDFMAGSQDLEMFLEIGIRATQATPLFSRAGALLGAFSTQWREPHELIESEARTLDILARQIADLMERTRIEEALGESEQQYRDLVRYAPAGIYEVNLRKKRLVSVNEAMCQMLGYSREELLTIDPFEILEEEDRALFRARIAAWLGGERPDENVEYRVKARDGRFIDAVLNVTFTADENGQPLGATVVAHDVTDRKQAHEALRESEERFRSSVENLLDAFAVYSSVRDEEGRIVDFRVEYANEAACQLTHRARENYVGRTVLELYPDLRQTPIFDWFVEGVETRRPIIKQDFAFDTAPLGISGIRYYDYRISRLGDGFTAAWEDVTERKLARDELEVRVKERTAELLHANEQLRQEVEDRTRAEQSLRLEEARLDALVHLSQLDRATLSEITGFVLEQGIALTESKIGFIGFLSEDESVYVLNAVSKDVVKECDVAGDPVQWHIADAGIWADAIRLRTTLFINDYGIHDPRKKGLPPGHPYVKRFMVVPILEEDRAVAVAGVGNKATDYDNSDQRQIALLLDGMWNFVQRNRTREALQQAYIKLQASEARFRTIFEEAPVGIALTDPEGRLVATNPTLQRLLDHAGRDLSGRNFFDLLSGASDDGDQLLRQLLDAPDNGRGQELRYLRNGEEAGVANVMVRLLRDNADEPSLVLALVEDITERKRTQEALIQAERLNAMGRIAASLAHEINNPIQAVVGCLGLARKQVGETGEVSRYMDVAIGELRRAARIVQQMRNLGRRTEERKEPADVGALVETALTLTQNRARTQKVEMVFEGRHALSPVPAVADRVQQVFLNIVLNALDSMPDGGELRIRAASTKEPPGVQISFADTGMGITPEELEHVFEAFHSTRELGLGLGLYVSRNIVQEHRGWIDVQTQVGQGTTFTVWLPAEPAHLDSDVRQEREAG
jgi:PAS domain S-box-containing protein